MHIYECTIVYMRIGCIGCENAPPSMPQKRTISSALLQKLGSAPLRRRALQHSYRPLCAAAINGVYPSLHEYALPKTKFTSAPSSICAIA